MLFPALLVPPRVGRLDTWYCAFGFACACSCASAGARAAPQQVALRTMKRIWIRPLVVSSVVIFCLLVEFSWHTLGTGRKSRPEPLRRFRTSHFTLVQVPD